MGSLWALSKRKVLKLVLNTDTVSAPWTGTGSWFQRAEAAEAAEAGSVLQAAFGNPAALCQLPLYWTTWDGSYRPRVDKLALRLFLWSFLRLHQQLLYLPPSLTSGRRGILAQILSFFPPWVYPLHRLCGMQTAGAGSDNPPSVHWCNCSIVCCSASSSGLYASVCLAPALDKGRGGTVATKWAL